jgi:nucleoside-diphosphate-sugar epimerase
MSNETGAPGVAPFIPVAPGELQPSPNPEGVFLWESSPSRYIAKVSLATGLEILRPIDPEELLVHAHRDRHPVELAAQFIASRVIERTGNEEAVRKGIRKLVTLGEAVAERVGAATGSRAIERQTKKLIGLADRDFSFQFREATRLSGKDVKARVEKLQADHRAALRARGRTPRFRILLTGASGFVGKEILAQAATDRRISEVIALLRPETIRDPKSGAVVRVLSPRERGALLLRRIGIAPRAAGKFRFVAGDIEKPQLGIAPAELSKIRTTITHVIHCAASVSFDDTYESSFRANVLGCRNALQFSLGVQKAKGSKFIHHVAIETSYIHGRRRRSLAQENALVFPRNFYNNFYELTKAMASIETDRFMIESGLRVVQLLPSIVIGDARTGNNRGDTKVVNAPVNAFGRAKEALQKFGGSTAGRAKAALVTQVALVFPGDRSAELNLVPVDRVVEGILAALDRPEAIGERIHLATDHRIRTEEIARLTREELGVNTRLVDPTLFRNVTLPLVKAALRKMGEGKLANALEKLGSIFGGYGEWGQPIHSVGNDVRILGLPLRRPDTEHAFRMLCRHNKHVQEFGKVRDPDELARREAVWTKMVDAIELETGRQVATIPAEEFSRLLSGKIDPRTFKSR